MKQFKLRKTLVIIGLVGFTFQAVANPQFEANHDGNGQFHANHAPQYRVNDNRFQNSNHENTERFGSTPNRFNNDTVNINERGGNPYNYTLNNQYHGWNQGPIGFNNGWSNGWSHGYNNGGFWTGVGEAVVGGLAATVLYNWLFNHNSSPSVAYANGSNSSGGYYNDSSSQQPDETINNTTTNNTVVEEDDSNIGLWLLGLGAIILAGAGLAYYLRRNRSSGQYEEDDYDELPRRNHARPAHYERNDSYNEVPQPRRLEPHDDYTRQSHNRVPGHQRERY